MKIDEKSEFVFKNGDVFYTSSIVSMDSITINLPGKLIVEGDLKCYSGIKADDVEVAGNVNIIGNASFRVLKASSIDVIGTLAIHESAYSAGNLIAGSLVANGTVVSEHILAVVNSTDVLGRIASNGIVDLRGKAKVDGDVFASVSFSARDSFQINGILKVKNKEFYDYAFISTRDVSINIYDWTVFTVLINGNESNFFKSPDDIDTMKDSLCSVARERVKVIVSSVFKAKRKE